MTLSRRLLMLMLAVLLPAAALLAWIITATYQREVESERQHVHETVRALALVVDREFDKRAAIARTLSVSSSLDRHDWHAFYAEARATTNGSGDWVMLTRGAQQLFNTTVPLGTPLPRCPVQPNGALLPGAVEVSDMRNGAMAGVPVVAVFAGTDPASTASAIGVAFTPSAMQAILNEQHLPEGWVAAIFDRQEHVAARSPHPELWVGHAMSHDLAAAMRRDGEGSMESVTFDGTIVRAYFSHSPEHGWGVVIGVPQQRLTAAARHAAWQAGGSALLLAVFAMLLATWSAQRIRRPILTLERAARDLAQDRVPAFVPTGLDEADAVGAALHRAGLQTVQLNDKLRRDEEAQRLLVTLHDAIRGQHDAQQVQWEIVSRVGRFFGASRCAWGEADPATGLLRIGRHHTDGVPVLPGNQPAGEGLRTLQQALQAGRTVAIDDVRADPRSNDSAALARFDAQHTRALLIVPLIDDGRLAAQLMLHDRAPRAWSAADIALLQQVAHRTHFATLNARAESELRENRQVLSLAMRSGRMGAWSRDMSDGRIWWSRELQEIVGLAAGSFEGTRDAVLRLIHPDDHAALHAAIDEAAHSDDDYRLVLRFRHASGAWRWMEWRGRAMTRPGGGRMLYGLGIDITERQLADAELQRLNAELAAADRRKDEFLATLAHELRNPLAPIANALEIMRRKNLDDPALRWTRDVIERQLRQMTRLVDDLLDVARITRGRIELRRERVDLAGVVQAAVEAARPLIDASQHTLAVQLPDAPLWIDADATRLTQVLLNLLNNAAKYTPAGGRLAIDARADGNGQACITVRDSGIGLDAEHLASVFEMFSQVQPAIERSQGGLGIGLALARGLVELHGGRIEARSAGAGLGSEFIVHLPLADAPALAPAAAPPRAAVRSALRVLVVDDNRDAADSLALVLQLGGHEVRVANDGVAALALAETFRPSLALLDIGMPGMNGYELARRLRGRPAGASRTTSAVPPRPASTAT
jgi:PAS domain S-box-containing protein